MTLLYSYTSTSYLKKLRRSNEMKKFAICNGSANILVHIGCVISVKTKVP